MTSAEAPREWSLSEKILSIMTGLHASIPCCKQSNRRRKPMNGKTARLIHKYASGSGLNEKQTKLLWNSLNRDQRTIERKKMLNGLNEKSEK